MLPVGRCEGGEENCSPAILWRRTASPWWRASCSGTLFVAVRVQEERQSKAGGVWLENENCRTPSTGWKTIGVFSPCF